MSLIITIDPGIDALGWAVFDDWGCDFFTDLKAPIDSGVCRTNKKDPWLVKTDDMAFKVGELFSKYKGSDCYHVACEMPKYMESAKGKVAARSDALVKLVFIVGRIAQVCHEYGIQFQPIPVGQWNGQLPKKIMEARVRKRLGISYREHEYDAVGIGLHLKGYFPNLPTRMKVKKNHGSKKTKKKTQAKQTSKANRKRKDG